MLSGISSIERQLQQRQVVNVYKENKDTKLGVTFYRRDPQDNAVPNAAIISRLGAAGPAAGKLAVGERIMQVQGVDVEGPLHAARMLRESEGYLRITKLPKRSDFDANIEKYAAIEQANARAAMEAALPGQQPQSTPRTDAATPRGPGAGTMPLLTGLRVINQPAPSNSSTPPDVGTNVKLALDVAGANVQAMQAQLAQATNKGVQDLQTNLGNLSARAGKFFGGLAAALPTEENKRNRAALKIQKAFRAFAARGQFHEERGAVLMLQAASRRHKAQAVLKYKKDEKLWAALAIQIKWKRHLRRKRAAKQAAERQAAEDAALANAPASARGSSPGILTKLSRSLSFSKRNKGKEGSTPRSNASDGTSTASSEPSPTETGAEPQTKKRSLSFTRRSKKPAPADEVHDVQQNV